ncbi:RNA polymerase sigma factor [Sinomicrobium sp. M5D2P9]
MIIHPKSTHTYKTFLFATMQYRLKTYQDREAFFLDLYKSFFPDVAAYVRKRGGTLDCARDIFQECLVVYYEQVIASDSRYVRNEKAYLMGVAKKLWYRMYAEGKRFSGEEERNGFAENNYEMPLPEISVSVNIMEYLDQAGRKCMDMLRAFYYDNYNMKEMAERFGFTSVRSATVQKYKCLEKVRDTVKEKSLNYEDFTA